MQFYTTKKSLRHAHAARGDLYLGHYGKRNDPTRTRKSRAVAKARKTWR